MSTVAERRKALRGTKRACQACAVRFYDLARDPIVCPSCAAHYTLMAPPIIAARAAPYSGKTGWRSRPFKRPADPIADPEIPVQGSAIADAGGEAEVAPPEDDTVLEQEQDDPEVSGLADIDTPDEGR